MKVSILSLAVATALSHPLSAIAADSAEVAELRQMIEAMKKQHEQQLKALEKRVTRAEAKAASTEKAVQSTQGQVAAVEQKFETKPKTGDNSFNPAISLVLQGGFAGYSEDPEEFALPGLPIGGEAGLQDEGLSLTELELTASANIDNLFYGQTTLGLHTEDGAIEVDIEEAYVDTLSLPYGFGLRFGRFYSTVGYLNEHHTHAWDFADAPLTHQAFLGGQYRDDGVRASWVAPLDEIFLELGVETLRGGAYPAGGNQGDFGAVRNFFANVGGDVGRDSSWQLGFSRLDIDVAERASGGHEDEEGNPIFSGDSDLYVLDAIWKTRLSNNRAFILQGEYFMRDENGQVSLSEDTGDALFNYDGEQDGWYLQGVYQFNPRWRTGVRYDHLTADNNLSIVSNTTGETDNEIFAESGFLSTGHDPYRWSAMVDWSPSEFSRLRLQYARDNSRDQVDNQIFLQYIMTLGAHGAHQF